jgi:3-phosphoshikimate 1-carboxyvinyltransferase
MPASAAAAAYLAVVVQGLPGSDVTLRGVSVNPSQSGVLDLLRSWGAPLTWEPGGDAALREPVADLRVRTAAVRGGVVDADALLRAGEALPALMLLGALSLRGLRLCDLPALGARRDASCAYLDPIFAAFGIRIKRAPGELQVPPKASWMAPSAPRFVDACSDPSLAITACTLALACPGETVVEHAAGALAAMYPGFIEAAQKLGASIEQV